MEKNSKKNPKQTSQQLFIHSSFPATHTVGNVVIFVLLHKEG